MAVDKFRVVRDTVDGASRDPQPITPHNSNELAVIPKALYVGTGGDITLQGANGSSNVVFKNVPSGAILPVRPLFIRSTGTTATDIVGL